MSSVRRTRVGDVLRLERRQVQVDLAAEYEEIGVRSFGRGIFHKEPIEGATLGNKRVFRIEPGDLVISNVFGWEGAIAVASEAEAGRIGSHRFMTFVARAGEIDTAWAAWYFLSEPGLELIRKASPGSAGRNKTLAVKRFENLVIPVPSIDEQRDVASRLGHVRGELAQLAARRTDAASYVDPTISAAVNRILERGRAAGWPEVPLGELASVNPGRTKLSPDEPASFVPMASVSAETGEVWNAEIRPAGEINGSYRQFQRGDILFARITPCMQNGKTAVFQGATEYGYGSSEFHVLRPREALHTRWLHHYLRSRALRDTAEKRMTGTAGQQRVPAAFLETTAVPVPPPNEIAAWVALFERLASLQLRVNALALHGDALSAAIEPAILNQVFEVL